MKKSVFFRVDGSAQIGLGHLVRCIALAQMLCNEFEITFISKEIPENTSVELRELHFDLVKIVDEADFFGILDQNKIVVLDHYGFDSDYQKIIKDKGAKLVFVDDLHSIVSFADLIINHAPGLEPSFYKAQVYTQFALGLDYVLLRPIFLLKAQSLTPSFVEGTAFICFGGSDSNNFTQNVVDILKTDNRFKKINVVVGAVYPFLDNLEKSILLDGRFFVYHSIESEMICNLMVESELAIVPSSGVLQEALAIGCKVISGMYVDNQIDIFERYKTLGAFQSAEDFSENNIRRAINIFFEQRDLPIKRRIDGKSYKRLLNIFKQISKEDDVHLKEAEEIDLTTTFRWATDIKIRAYSFNKDEIGFLEHSNWFLEKINSQFCYYFIGCIDHVKIGSIRFDIQDNIAIVSYLLDPDFHSQGLGIVLLKKGLEALISKNDSRIDTVIGFVMPQNIPSVKSFERLGYDKIIDGEIFKFKKRIV